MNDSMKKISCTTSETVVSELTALNQRADYPRDVSVANRTLRSFTIYSFLFAANPCAAVACLSLATARLGQDGAFSSAILYLAYTLSSVTGATYIVKQMGGRKAMMAGMSMYCCYVWCFWIAVTYREIGTVAVAGGAFIGGIGAGVTWTAQGSYFSSAAEDHALNLGCDWSQCTASLSGIFAFAYLIEESILHVSSYFLLQWGVRWNEIFAIYSMIAVLSTASMMFVKDYPPSREDDNALQNQCSSVIVTLNLLLRDRKMPFLIGLNAVFGFAGSFLNSFVSGEVIRTALDDQKSETIGLFAAWTAGVASVSSLIIGKITHDYGKMPVVVFGNMAFFSVSMLFVLRPNLAFWTWKLLLLVYTLHGIGRATFESAVKATFADLFPFEKEGAFANIILQNGLFGSLGYALTFILTCSTEGSHCVVYRNGTLHNILAFELIVCISAVVAVLGYLRAMNIHCDEQSVGADDSQLKQYKDDCMNAHRKRWPERT